PPPRADPPPPADAGCGVIFVGNLIPRKNVHRLIRAVQALPHVRLDLYGNDATDPRYTRRLRRMIAGGGLGERVTIHGRVSDETLAAAYRHADLLAAPSAYEGFGIVYLEALSQGVPVIAGRRGGAAEIVTSADAGALVSPRVGPIVRAIRRVCGNGERRGDRRRTAWQRSRAFPDWTETMSGAAHFLEEIVRRCRDG
nr:glycosyltransferase [Spirochaeta sp.]